MKAAYIKVILAVICQIACGSALTCQVIVDTSYFSYDARMQCYYPKEKLYISDFNTEDRSIFYAKQRYDFVKGLEYSVADRTFYRFDQYANGVRLDGNCYLISCKRDGEIISVSGKVLIGSLPFSAGAVISSEAAIQTLLGQIGGRIYRWDDPREELLLRDFLGKEEATYFPEPQLSIKRSDNANHFDESAYRQVYTMNVSSLISEDFGDYADSSYIIDALNGQIIARKSGTQCHEKMTSCDLQKDRNNGNKSCAEAQGNSLKRLYPSGVVNQMSCNAPCQQGGVTVDYYGGQNIHTSEIFIGANCTHRLRNTCNTSVLHTRKQNHVLGQAIDYHSTNNSWPQPGDHEGITAQWCLEQTYETFKSMFGFNSVDNNFSQVNVLMDDQNATSWTQSAKLINIQKFGGQTDWQTTLDIVGHEFGHGLMISNANLDAAPDMSSIQNLNFSAEKATLCEGFADIYGEIVEFFVSQNVTTSSSNVNDFVHGGARPGGAQAGHERSMFDPPSTNNPDFIGGVNFDSQTFNANSTPLQFSSKIHQNATIFGHWYFLLSNGSAGSQSNANGAFCVKGIGQMKASQIAFHAMMFELANFTQSFQGGMDATMQAAANLFGQNSVEVAEVASAWKAVGLGSGYNGTIDISNTTLSGNANIHFNSPVKLQNVTIQSGANVQISSAALVTISPPVTIQNGAFTRIFIGPACIGGARVRGPRVISQAEFNEVEEKDNELVYTEEELCVVPNPSSGLFYVSIPGSMGFPNTVSVSSILGAKVMEFKLVPGKRIEVDLTEHPAGLYNLQMSFGGWSINKKLVKQ